MPSAKEVLSAFRLPSKVRLLEIGQTFGMLTVTEHAMPLIRANGRAAARSICLCECGSERAYKNNGLLSGYWQSCGCKQKEHAAEGRVTHGHARGGRRSPELTAFRMMIRRCSDKRDRHWNDYGGRGIRVCDRWLAGFEVFLADMGPRPSPDHSIEREDNDGHYEPGNCRWAPSSEQANNKRTTFRVAFGGAEMSLAELARMTGQPSGALRRRLLAGMTAEEAVESARRRKRLPSRRGP